MSRQQSDFARVYDEHVWQVYGFFAYRVGDRAAAEDLTQATFERALRAWSRFDSRRGSERTWLFAIARNLLIDHHRRRRSQPLVSLVQTDLEALIRADEHFESPLELDEALAQLSVREREVLALRYGGDLSGPEIAALLGLTLANVQQIASRSLRKLRELLELPQNAPTASSAPKAIRTAPSSR
jgi:RNA polymerase sigma-70 factor (ECF subfamily)